MPLVTVIGAGLTGLVAAWELERLGHRVEILEGAGRVGGRIRTHRFAGSAPVDLGARRLHVGHHHTLRCVQELGLAADLGPFRRPAPDDRSLQRAVARVGRVLDVAEPTVGTLTVALATLLAPADLGGGQGWSAIAEHTARLCGPTADGPPSGAAVTAGEAVTPDVLHRLLRTADRAGPPGPAWAGLIERIRNEIDPDFLELRGGSGDIIRRLTERISGTVHFDHELTALEVQGGEVRVWIRHHGIVTTRRPEYVICTVPPTVLRRMPLHGVSPQKVDLFRATRGWSTTKVAVQCAEPVDDLDLPSDMRMRPLVTRHPDAVLLAGYSAQDADRLGRMAVAKRHAAVVADLGLGAVHAVESVAWGQSPWSLGAGAVLPGDGSATVTLRRPDGRLFFAGDYSGQHASWMDGAIESAMQTAHDVHDVAGRTSIGVT